MLHVYLIPISRYNRDPDSRNIKLAGIASVNTREEHYTIPLHGQRGGERGRRESNKRCLTLHVHVVHAGGGQSK